MIDRTSTDLGLAASLVILNSFRVISSIAIVLSVVVEMIGRIEASARNALPAGNLCDTGNMLAGIVVSSLLGLGVSWLIGRAERALLTWR